MQPSSIDLPDRARGALLGALGGGGADPLLEILAEELAEGRTDLRRLAGRWVEHHRQWPVTGDPDTAAALEELAAHDAPPATGGRGSGALARTVPVALVAARSPRSLVSATFHIAGLTHPDPAASWGAVAVNVALARLLHGTRDFVPDVLEALRGNGAPDRLVDAVRRVPLVRREALPAPADTRHDAVAGVLLALGLAYHEPLAARGFDSLRASDASAPAAAAGALLGARDGAAAVPGHLLQPEEAIRWAGLAEQLIRMAPVGGG